MNKMASFSTRNQQSVSKEMWASEEIRCCVHFDSLFRKKLKLRYRLAWNITSDLLHVLASTM